MHIHFLDNGPSEMQPPSLNVMQKGRLSGLVNTPRAILSPYNLTVVVKQGTEAKLTPYYSLITVVMPMLHKCRHNMWNCTGFFLGTIKVGVSKAAFPYILISSLFSAK